MTSPMIASLLHSHVRTRQSAKFCAAEVRCEKLGLERRGPAFSGFSVGLESSDMTTVPDDVRECVTCAVIRRVGPRIVLALPLGIGKP